MYPLHFFLCLSLGLPALCCHVSLPPSVSCPLLLSPAVGWVRDWASGSPGGGGGSGSSMWSVGLSPGPRQFPEGGDREEEEGP